MFQLNHWLWLLVAAFIITFHILINLKFKLSLKTNLTILFIISMLSETTKILTHMNFLAGETFDQNGYYLGYGSLPFHLCTIQIFLVVALMFFIKNEKTKQSILDFMVPTMLFGALLAILIPTAGTAFNEITEYEYFIYHSFLIAFALYLLYSKNVKITSKVMFRNIGLLLGLGVMSIYINGMLSFERTNFMYTSRPPMENLPILNLDQGWHMYLLKLICILVILMVGFHMPFIIIARRKKNKGGI